MEVKIGIRQSNREVAVETEKTAAELADAIASVLKDESLLVLEDTKVKGRKVMVPASEISYVETGAEPQARVGFGIA